MPQDPASIAERLRDANLPPDAAIALILGDKTRAVPVAREIQSIQRGETPPIVAEIDQVNAFLTVGYLRHAIAEIGSDLPASRLVEKVAADFERLIAVDCPELARVVAEHRQEDRTHG